MRYMVLVARVGGSEVRSDLFILSVAISQYKYYTCTMA